MPPLRPPLPLLDDFYFADDLQHRQFFYSHFSLHVPHDPPLPPIQYPTHPAPIPPEYSRSGSFIPLELVPRGPINVELYLPYGDPRPGRVAAALARQRQQERQALQPPAAQHPFPPGGNPAQDAQRGPAALRPVPPAARDLYYGAEFGAQHGGRPPPAPPHLHQQLLNAAAGRDALQAVPAQQFYGARHVPAARQPAAHPPAAHPPAAVPPPARPPTADPPAARPPPVRPAQAQDGQNAALPDPEPDFNVLVPTAAHGANGVVNTTLVVAGNIAPDALFDKICAALKIHATAAKLAYKVSNQRDAPGALSNVEDMKQAIEKFLACRRRAHIANRAAVELRIINLAPTAAQHGDQGRRGTKRAANDTGNVISLASDRREVAYDFPRVPGYPSALAALKAALLCKDKSCNPREDPVHWCFLNKHGVLVRVSLRWITLWAKFMAEEPDTVTPQRPPNSDDFEFLDQKKRSRRNEKAKARESAPPTGPVVNIHNDFGGFMRDILRPSKRINTGARHESDTSASESDDDVKSRTAHGTEHNIAALLAALDAAKPGYNFAQYGPALEANGICEPVHLLTVEPSMFVDLLDIPADVVSAMVARAKELLGPQKLVHSLGSSSSTRASSSHVTVEDYDKENWEY